MAERRQVARPEPIELEVRGKVFVAEPLPWMICNDLGNNILQQNTEATNNLVKMYVEGNIPQLEVLFKQKISDWYSVLKIAYPKMKPEDFQDLHPFECSELLCASLEVNGLDHLKHLVDPNSPTPDSSGESAISDLGEMIEVGPRTLSSPDSSDGASPETAS